jgi:mono/diheme cytochrome c family protein
MRAFVLLLLLLLLLLAAAVAAPAQAGDGAATFRARCAACHGETGRADSLQARALKVPPLQDYERLRGMKAAEIAAAVRANAKHASITNINEEDLLAAAEHVTRLVRLGPLTPRAAPRSARPRPPSRRAPRL